jgi:replicative DNA helicase Mcm
VGVGKVEPTELIKQADAFLRKYYPTKDSPSPRKIIDLHELILDHRDLVEEMVENPEEVFKAFDLAAEQIYDDSLITHVRVKGWHDFSSFVMLLRDVRSKHIGKLITVECDISVFAPPKTSVSSVRWECNSCGNVITMLQIPKGVKDEKVVKPGQCNKCMAKSFRKLSTEYIDVQRLAVREPIELIEHNVQNPRQMGVLLKADMCHKDMDTLISAGIRVFLTGIVRLEKPEQPESDFIIDAHYIHFVQEDTKLNFTADEIKSFKDFAAKEGDILGAISNSFAIHISGEMNPKKALLLMIVSGDEKKNKGSKETNQINVLFVGNPGSGKSQLGLHVKDIFPKTRYINAQTTTSVGLTAAAIEDKFLGGWIIQAGEIVLAHRGILVIDDFDGMPKEEQDALHEAMSLKTGGNASATLKCETNVLAICNPKYKTWDNSRTLISQIEISKSMLDRFDLIYLFKGKKEYSQMRDGIQRMFRTFVNDDEEKEETKLDPLFIKKYLSYAKRQNPRFSDDVFDISDAFFADLFAKKRGEDVSPISMRQPQSFFRLAKASAKLILSPMVAEQDAEIAKKIMWDYLKAVAYDEQSGTFDIEMIEGTIKVSDKNKFAQLELLIMRMAKEEAVDEGVVIASAMGELGLTEDQVADFLKILVQKGDIFLPRKGFVKAI